MKAHAFGNIREAINATATGNGPMKLLAAELDWSPSEFSRRTTLGDENSLAFPADDRLIKIQRVTGDFSILRTMAESLGFEVHAKRAHLPDILLTIQQIQAELGLKIQQIELALSRVDKAGPKKGSR